MDTAIELHAVGMTRQRQVVLHDVDWRVEDGERWVLLGPNGAGKSSILKVAATYDHASTGTIIVLGETLGRTLVQDLRLRLGYTASSLERLMDQRMSVREAVASGFDAKLVRFGSTHDEERWAAVDASLARVGLAAIADRRLALLSEGERRRVQIARASLTGPELLLLDEPTAGLDIAGREQLLGLLEDIAADPAVRAVALVTHHVEEIPRGFTHVALVADGTIVEAGPIEEVLTSAALSRAFDHPLEVRHQDGRFAARGLQT
ncbi:MAG: ATP-binding cassette domain-containing protein [Actinomycetota bacterium]